MSKDTGIERYRGETNRPSGAHNAAFRNTQRRRVHMTWIVALGVIMGNASPTSAGAHSRPDGSQWWVVRGTRGPAPGGVVKVGSPAQAAGPCGAYHSRGVVPKDTRGGAPRRGEEWVRALSRREDHTRSCKGVRTPFSAVLSRPGSGAGARPRTRNMDMDTMYILCRARS